MIRVLGIQTSRRQAALFLADIAILTLVMLFSVFLRFGSGGSLEYIAGHVPHFLVMILAFIISFLMADLYDIKKDFRLARQQLHIYGACCIALAISTVIFYSSMTNVGRSIFLLIGFFAPLSIGLIRWFYITVGSAQQWRKRVIVVGAGGAGHYLLKTILRHSHCGLWIVGFVDDDSAKQGKLINVKPIKGKRVNGKPVLGTSAELTELAQKFRADMIVIAVTHDRSDILVKNLIKCHYMNITVVNMPTVYEHITGKLPLQHITEKWLLDHAIFNQGMTYKNIKRVLDICFALVLLTVSFPVMILTSILIKLDSKGDVFFRQERVGMNFKKFNIVKFRTMVADAEKHTGAVWAIKGDPRVTRVGKIMRKLRIDEIPQLVNVLIGNMSFVGPRPEREVFINELNKEIPAYGHRLVVKPGITGWAQVMYSYAATKEESIEKLRYDLYYVKNMSLFLDIFIILKTIRTVLSCGGH